MSEKMKNKSGNSFLKERAVLFLLLDATFCVMKNSVDNIYRGVIYNIYRITIYLIAMYPNVIYRIEMHREESVFPVLKEKRRKMEDRIRKIYCPMTETGFYILYCLQRPAWLRDRAAGEGDDRKSGCYQSRNHVWHTFQDGGGRADPV